jgi:SAM-dependent methyltransferase
MSRLLGTHSVASAWNRLRNLVGELGVLNTLALVLGTIDDRWINSFDRRYRIRTSGFIELRDTSFNTERLPDATQYGPTNGWAARKMLKTLVLPSATRFCDIGCGLGRVCVLAAEFDYARVTGVELAPELCTAARVNVTNSRLSESARAKIHIVEIDALDYCAATDDDVFFMFRPFSGDFLTRVLDQLAKRARERNTSLTLIYTERVVASASHNQTIAAHGAFVRNREATHLGQAFFVFTCSPDYQPPAP